MHACPPKAQFVGNLPNIIVDIKCISLLTKFNETGVTNKNKAEANTTNSRTMVIIIDKHPLESKATAMMLSLAQQVRQNNYPGSSINISKFFFLFMNCLLY